MIVPLNNTPIAMRSRLPDLKASDLHRPDLPCTLLLLKAHRKPEPSWWQAEAVGSLQRKQDNGLSRDWRHLAVRLCGARDKACDTGRNTSSMVIDEFPAQLKNVPFGLNTTLSNSPRSNRRNASANESSSPGRTRSMKFIAEIMPLFRISACKASAKMYLAGQRPNWMWMFLL